MILTLILPAPFYQCSLLYITLKPYKVKEIEHINTAKIILKTQEIIPLDIQGIKGYIRGYRRA